VPVEEVKVLWSVLDVVVIVEMLPVGLAVAVSGTVVYVDEGAEMDPRTVVYVTLLVESTAPVSAMTPVIVVTLAIELPAPAPGTSADVGKSVVSVSMRVVAVILLATVPIPVFKGLEVKVIETVILDSVTVVAILVGLNASVPGTPTVDVEVIVWSPDIVVKILIQEPSDS
jgi:hypothetical protein